jgi:uncharacterized protein (TIGR02145 family)
MKKSLTLIFLLCSIVSFTQNTTGTITDTRDGKVYKTVVIGNQTWMAENLNVASFRNGDPIPEAKTKEEWDKATAEGKPAWCYYNNDTANGKIYGKLYNFHAVDDTRGLAPKGWHVPSDSEFTILTDYLGGESIAGKKMKIVGVYETKITFVEEGGYYETKWVTCNNCSYWTEKQKANNPCSACRNERGKIVNTGKYIPKTKRKIEEKIKTSGWNGTNESGFLGIPGGRLNGNPEFEYIGITGYWWSSTRDTSDDRWDPAWLRYLDDYIFGRDEYGTYLGLSVRCIKN